MTLSLTDWLSDFWFWHYRVTLETCDLWDIWSEWWGDMTWLKKTYLPTFCSALYDDETWHDQKICLPTNQTPSRSDPRHLWQLRHLISSDDLTFRVFSNGAIIGTCDICDTDYNTDNWEPGLIAIFVTWQLIVTLDSIHNSCDVWGQNMVFSLQCWHSAIVWNCVGILWWQQAGFYW